MWQAWAIFAPQNQPKVEQGLREEIARAQGRLHAAGTRGKAKGLLSARSHARAQDGVLADALASNLYLGRTFAVSQKIDDAIAAATLADVNAALHKVPEAGPAGDRVRWRLQALSGRSPPPPTVARADQSRSASASERAKVRLVVLPLIDGARIQRLPDLAGAGRPDGARVWWKSRRPGPRGAREVDDPA